MILYLLSGDGLKHARVVELADASDSKSEVREGVRVRFPPLAPNKKDFRENISKVFFILLESNR